MIKTIVSLHDIPRTLESLEDGNYIVYGKSRCLPIVHYEEILGIMYEGNPAILVGDNLQDVFGVDFTVGRIEHILDIELPNCYKLIKNK